MFYYTFLTNMTILTHYILSPFMHAIYLYHRLFIFIDFLFFSFTITFFISPIVIALCSLQTLQCTTPKSTTLTFVSLLSFQFNSVEKCSFHLISISCSFISNVSCTFFLTLPIFALSILHLSTSFQNPFYYEKT